MKTLKAVLFDMDGLMFDTEKIYYQANQTIADNLGISFNRDFYNQYVGSSFEVVLQALVESGNSSEIVEEFAHKSDTLAEDTLLNGKAEVKLGLVDLLNNLSDKSIKMFVVSSSKTKFVKRMVENVGLDNYFDGLIGGDMVEHSKPAPDIYELAAKELPYPKSELLILEDSENGVRAGYGAGIDTLMVPDLIQASPEVKQLALAVLDDLYEVKEYIFQNFKVE